MLKRLYAAHPSVQPLPANLSASANPQPAGCALPIIVLSDPPVLSCLAAVQTTVSKLFPRMLWREQDHGCCTRDRSAVQPSPPPYSTPSLPRSPLLNHLDLVSLESLSMSPPSSYLLLCFFSVGY